MDLQTLQSKLIDLDQIGEEISKECGYTNPSTTLEYVKWDLQNPDEAFLHDEMRDIINVLNFIHYRLAYLQKPISHEGILQYNRKRGYEVDGVQLHTDEWIEVLIIDDETQISKWELHFLTEHSKHIGKKVRIRR